MSLWRYGWWLDGSPAASGMFASSQTVLDAGKYYWEVALDEGGADGTNGYGILFGVATSIMPLTGTVCTAINVAQINSEGGLFWNGRANNPFSNVNGWGYPDRASGGGVIETVGTTGVYGIKFDAIAGTIGYRNITDDSPAGVTVFASTTVTDVIPDASFLHVMCGASHGSGAAKGVGTVNFGASAFTGAVPSGFVSVYSVFPSAKLNSADNSNLVLSNGDLTFSGEDVPVTFSPAVEGFTTNVGYSSSIRSNFLIALA